MTEDDFLSTWSTWQKAHSWSPDPGEVYAEPPLEILGYATKPVRLSRVPVFGRGLAVVAITRHPVDLMSDAVGLQAWVERIGKAVNGLHPPWKSRRPGAVLLTAVQLTPEPIRGEDEERFKAALGHWTGTRVVPAAIVRINLGQHAMASMMAEGLPRDMPELGELIDIWAGDFHRFVPMWNDTEAL
ncbi:hypothetical protein GC170_06010 [bacterium]|nr:hypothetical protein [bacterium]